ncbi:MAG TPA: hypothetical protein VGO87_09570, partial [Acidimicrobiia bacterium]
MLLSDEGTFTFRSWQLQAAGKESGQHPVLIPTKEAIMATGISLFFLAVGAILTFAVHTAVNG